MGTGVKIHAGEGRDGAVTVELHGEDHTLGNALRYVMMKNKHTQFCSYSVPHPSEHVIHLRAQAYPDERGGDESMEDAENAESEHVAVRSMDLVHQGLDDLVAMCDAVKRTFEAAIDAHDAAASSGQAAESQYSR
ncbi:DNA-directed RNA polymerases I and III subunit RPAC2 [Porphyridium purpureum]|uniref:DNA-directed RNA polymerases I and III subunit RPAC2 n=1 Tax=Porphyridium purpureum TaxID=35688 RepID=A0A5J4YPW9_PORPP|nr:DNA-directed RNA polymerases I and III subunit RPAC2 [Porphyridium purpureum]|eukprot:POR2396..scf296_7